MMLLQLIDLCCGISRWPVLQVGKYFSRYCLSFIRLICKSKIRDNKFSSAGDRQRVLQIITRLISSFLQLSSWEGGIKKENWKPVSLSLTPGFTIRPLDVGPRGSRFYRPSVKVERGLLLWGPKWNTYAHAANKAAQHWFTPHWS